MKSLLLALLLTTACGGKKAAPEAAATQAAAEAAAAAAATQVAATAPEPEPEPEPPPEVINADLQVTLQFADGTSKSGKVKRIERSDDFYGEAGWLTESKRLNIEGESGATLKNIPWTEVKSISVTPGKVPADVSCTYSTDTTPWMYDCTVSTSARLTAKDGSAWTVSNRHKWRLTFADDTAVEFWLYKFSAREQDEKVVDIYTENPENLELYSKLQDKLRTDLKSTLFVTGITVQ